MKNMDSGCRPVFLDELHLDLSPLCVSKGRQMQKAKHKVPYNKTELKEQKKKKINLIKRR